MLLKLLMLMSLTSLVTSYKILCVFPVPSRSHHLLGEGIVRALLDAGHEVTFLTPYPDKVKPRSTLKVLDGSSLQTLIESLDMSDPKHKDMNLVMQFATDLSIAALRNEQFRDAVLKDKFDAVVTEWFFSELQAGIAEVLQVPWIMLSCNPVNPLLEYYTDDIRSPNVLPMLVNDYQVPMTLFQRLKNWFVAAMIVGKTIFSVIPSLESVYLEEYGELAAARGVKLSSLSEATLNVSILLVNSHSSIDASPPAPDNVVKIAGYHIDENTPPLPKDLQEVMDASPQGVVYFSMGSVLKGKVISPEIRGDIIKLLGSLPHTVLWKFDEPLENLPKNIHVRKWMPQTSILAHPNTRLFITHGGLLSTLEAVHYGVPLLAIPVFGDQPANAARAQNAGFGRVISLGDQLPHEMAAALKEMLETDRFYKQAKSVSKLFHNRPVKPSKLVSHYVELAIETKGAPHLRSKSTLYPWYSRWALDIILFTLATICVIFYILRMIINTIFKNSEQKLKQN